jgi:hypothetical protein
MNATQLFQYSIASASVFYIVALPPGEASCCSDETLSDHSNQEEDISFLSACRCKARTGLITVTSLEILVVMFHLLLFRRGTEIEFGLVCDGLICETTEKGAMVNLYHLERLMHLPLSELEQHRPQPSPATYALVFRIYHETTNEAPSPQNNNPPPTHQQNNKTNPVTFPLSRAQPINKKSSIFDNDAVLDPVHGNFPPQGAGAQ